MMFPALLLLLATCQAQTDLDSTVATLRSLLEPVPPQGLPFPRIRGPNTSDRVCIVGAGPAGVHMALSLKRRGYSNLTIYEKSNRVGGMSFDINYRGVPQHMGTHLADPNYFDNLIPLAQEYGAGDLVKIPTANVWASNSGSQPGSQLLTSQYILGSLVALTNSSSPQVNLGFLIQNVVRYVRLHKELFGSYSGDLMLQPSARVMVRLRGTILDFLTRENLLALVPIFKLSITQPGYGYLDETPALYGLIWNNPKLLIALALRALKKDEDPMSVYILGNGYENVWKRVVEKEGLNIQFDTDIYSIKRTYHGIDMKVWKDSYIQTTRCDFLIWTPDMSHLLRALADASHKEWSIFRGLKTETYTTSLVNMRNERRNGPQSVFMENLDRKVEGGVALEASMMGYFAPGIRTKEGLAEYNANNSEMKTTTVYQLSKSSDEQKLNNILRQHYTEGFNATDLEILNTISWRYFPRWSPREVEEGRHWQVSILAPTQLVTRRPFCRCLSCRASTRCGTPGPLSPSSQSGR